ncbi:MAG: hypothetical protein U0411_14910 [Thermodesulfovibrionales bacterium]
MNQDAGAAERRFDRYCPDDICSNEELQAEQYTATELAACFYKFLKKKPKIGLEPTTC